MNNAQTGRHHRTAIAVVDIEGHRESYSHFPSLYPTIASTRRPFRCRARGPGLPQCILAPDIGGGWCSPASSQVVLEAAISSLASPNCRHRVHSPPSVRIHHASLDSPSTHDNLNTISHSQSHLRFDLDAHSSEDSCNSFECPSHQLICFQIHGDVSSICWNVVVPRIFCQSLLQHATESVFPARHCTALRAMRQTSDTTTSSSWANTLDCTFLYLISRSSRRCTGKRRIRTLCLLDSGFTALLKYPHIVQLVRRAKMPSIGIRGHIAAEHVDTSCVTMFRSAMYICDLRIGRL